jgi:hypothetical protein
MFLKSSYNAITTTMAPYHMISFRLICTSDVLVDISYLITRWMGIFRKNRKQAWLVAITSYIRWNEDDVHFVLVQHAQLYFYSASSLKQQSVGRYVSPLGHIILISSWPVLAVKQYIPILLFFFTWLDPSHSKMVFVS